MKSKYISSLWRTLIFVEVVLVGARGVGKSSIFNRKLRNSFSPSYESTRSSIEKTLTVVNKSGVTVGMRVVDIGSVGGVMVHTNQQIIGTSDAVVVVYDVTDYTSFLRSKFWVALARRECKDDVVIILAGTKIDRSSDIQISVLEVERYAKETNLIFFPVSAKDDTNINELFIEVASRIPKGEDISSPVMKEEEIIEIVEPEIRLGYDRTTLTTSLSPTTTTATTTTTTSNNNGRIRVCIIGDPFVGKSQLIHSFFNRFSDDYTPTIFDSYNTTILDGGQETVEINIMDTPGHGDFDDIRYLPFSGTDIFIIAFSISNPTSLENIRVKWIPQITGLLVGEELGGFAGEMNDRVSPFIVVGCKSDLRDDAQTIEMLKEEDGQSPVTFEQASQFCEGLGLRGGGDDKTCSGYYVECSGMNREGVTEVFQTVVSKYRQHVIDKEQQQQQLKGKESQHQKEREVITSDEVKEFQRVEEMEKKMGERIKFMSSEKMGDVEISSQSSSSNKEKKIIRIWRPLLLKYDRKKSTYAHHSTRHINHSIEKLRTLTFENLDERAILRLLTLDLKSIRKEGLITSKNLPEHFIFLKTLGLSQEIILLFHLLEEEEEDHLSFETCYNLFRTFVMRYENEYVKSWFDDDDDPNKFPIQEDVKGTQFEGMFDHSLTSFLLCRKLSGITNSEVYELHRNLPGMDIVRLHVQKFPHHVSFNRHSAIQKNKIVIDHPDLRFSDPEDYKNVVLKAGSRRGYAFYRFRKINSFNELKKKRLRWIHQKHSNIFNRKNSGRKKKKMKVMEREGLVMISTTDGFSTFANLDLLVYRSTFFKRFVEKTMERLKNQQHGSRKQVIKHLMISKEDSVFIGKKEMSLLIEQVYTGKMKEWLISQKRELVVQKLEKLENKMKKNNNDDDEEEEEEEGEGEDMRRIDSDDDYESYFPNLYDKIDDDKSNSGSDDEKMLPEFTAKERTKFWSDVMKSCIKLFCFLEKYEDYTLLRSLGKQMGKYVFEKLPAEKGVIKVFTSTGHLFNEKVAMYIFKIIGDEDNSVKGFFNELIQASKMKKKIKEMESDVKDQKELIVEQEREIGELQNLIDGNVDQIQ